MNAQDSEPSLAAALAEADLRVLLMVLYHLTGDESWLQAPFLPQRDTRIIADPSAGFDPQVAQRIRAAVIDLAERGQLTPVVSDPGPRLQHMMSVCLGETVPAEYAPMMADEMRFVPVEPQWPASSTGVATQLPDVLIIGAGLSGISLAYRLRRLGIPFRVIERKGEVGGTWSENRYPGCGVDTPNHMYSFSFAPNPHWSKYFSPRAELREYAERCVDDFGVREAIEFDSEVVGAAWGESAGRWRVQVRRAGVVAERSVAVLVSAIGHFSQPNEMPIPGAEQFAGPVFHSAYWPEDVNLQGKRVAVVGTGASAMQIVPRIAGEVAHLDIFQRTPQWVRPVAEFDQQVSPAARWLFERLPYYEAWYRFTLLWRYGDGVLRFLARDPEWEQQSHLSVNRHNDRHRVEMTEYIRGQLAERPDLVEKCVPDYPPFGKRMLIDNGWYAALTRDEVDLVTDPISRIDEAGLVMRDGTHRAADVIVMATGFTVTDLCARIGIVGRDGRALADDWANENPTAYLGMTVPGFPNFFCMFGPNTNMGHGGSAIFLAEAQSRYIASGLVQLAEQGLSSIDCRPEVRARFIDTVDDLHARLIWTHPGMGTYYRNSFGRVVSTMPFRLVDYWHMTKDFDLGDYEAIRRNETSFRSTVSSNPA